GRGSSSPATQIPRTACRSTEPPGSPCNLAGMESITLDNGLEMPKLGLGVFQMNDEEVRASVPEALDAGYRLIDTASRYYNERAVGAAIAEAGVPREELF